MVQNSNSDEEFQQILDFLNKTVNYETFQSLPYDQMQKNMERLKAIHRLIFPKKPPFLVHITGTKGKGSTAMILECLLRTQGLKTGMFTSPHLESVLERFQINGKPCSKDIFARSFFELKQQLDALSSLNNSSTLSSNSSKNSSKNTLNSRINNPSELRENSPLTFFEWTTLLALKIFEKEQTDAVILEVGMGGRFDATNICSPDVCIITGISFDHIDQLGPTLQHIAYEKAGIIKEKIPVICGLNPDNKSIKETSASPKDAAGPLQNQRSQESYPSQPQLQTPNRLYPFQASEFCSPLEVIEAVAKDKNSPVFYVQDALLKRPISSLFQKHFVKKKDNSPSFFIDETVQQQSKKNSLVFVNKSEEHHLQNLESPTEQKRIKTSEILNSISSIDSKNDSLTENYFFPDNLTSYFDSIAFHLLGKHQRRNAAAALLAASFLPESFQCHNSSVFSSLAQEQSSGTNQPPSFIPKTSASHQKQPFLEPVSPSSFSENSNIIKTTPFSSSSDQLSNQKPTEMKKEPKVSALGSAEFCPFLEEKTVRYVLESLELPGRVEPIHKENPIIILDGAHNRESALSLTETLQTAYPNVHKTLLFATTRGKDVAGMLETFFPIFDKIVLSIYGNGPRAFPLDELIQITKETRQNLLSSISAQADSIQDSPQTRFISDTRIPKIETIENPNEYVLAFLQNSAPSSVHSLLPIDPIKTDEFLTLQQTSRQQFSDHLLCVAGSFYLVGKIRQLWTHSNKK